MIKQIWFVRNITKLFVSLSLAINGVITLYSTLSALALTQTLGEENIVISMLQQYNGLLFFPLIGWCFFLFFFGLGLYLKRARKKFIKHKTLYKNEEDITNPTLSSYEEMRLIFLSKFITATNFSTSVTIAFFSLDIVSQAKNISSFGLFPIILCVVATLYYYIILVIELHKSKSKYN